ncbi:MAG TPA: sugar phosphate isomerase/epimerase [Planctomycetes bacterium]|nr:sugar phosphate isomerase/epimerase [Planctomycetota bacterium]
MPPIALQLYSVRAQAKEDFAGTVRQVAQMGYPGVEPAGFPGTTPEEAGKLFRSLGLKVPSAHGGLPVGDDKNKVLDALDAIGCKRIISGRGPKDFESIDAIKNTCALFNEAAENAAARGFAFGIHNHWWEFNNVDGRLVFDVMLELLSPKVFFQLDTYWAKTGGADPVAVINRLGKRAPLLHMKDGPCVTGQPHVAVGKGKMDFPSIVAAARNVDWFIVELDECATDMMQAVKESYDYLAKITRA